MIQSQTGIFLNFLFKMAGFFVVTKLPILYLVTAHFHCLAMCSAVFASNRFITSKEMAIH